MAKSKKPKGKIRKIVVFSDGETWEMAEGAIVCEVSPNQFKKLEAGDYPKALRLVGTPVLSTTDRVFNRVVDEVEAMDPKTRMALFWAYCPKCGRKVTECAGCLPKPVEMKKGRLYCSLPSDVLASRLTWMNSVQKKKFVEEMRKANVPDCEIKLLVDRL